MVSGASFLSPGEVAWVTWPEVGEGNGVGKEGQECGSRGGDDWRCVWGAPCPLEAA